MYEETVIFKFKSISQWHKALRFTVIRRKKRTLVNIVSTLQWAKLKRAKTVKSKH